MARTRTIKPEFWSDEKIGSLSFMERLLFVGLWNFADDEGIIKASPLYLKANIFPYDNIKETDLAASLDKLEKLNMIFRYGQHNQRYLWVIKFRVYQRIDKPQKSHNPPPPIQNNLYKRAIFYRDNYICHICGEMTCPQDNSQGCSSGFPSVDHLIPKSKNGSNFPSNLATACISCNKSRGSNDLEPSENDLGTFQEPSENDLGTFQAEEKLREEKLNEKKERYAPPDKSNGDARPAPPMYSCECFEIDPEYLEELCQKFPLLPGKYLTKEFFPRMRDWCLDNRKNPKHRQKFNAQGKLKSPRSCFSNWLKNEDPAKAEGYMAPPVKTYQPPEETDLLTPTRDCPNCGGSGAALNPPGSKEKYRPCECLHPVNEDKNGKLPATSA